MKKLLVIASLVAAALLLTGCFTQKPAVTLTPITITLKVGESFQLTPGTEGEASDLIISKVQPVQSSNEDVCYIDRYWTVHAVGKGTAKVGAAIMDEKGEKALYSAFTTVNVL